MMEPWHKKPLQGSAVYNPALLSQQELKTLFVARRKLLERVLEDLRLTGRQGTPQHRLVVGSRGMGKTTLLHRLALSVEEEEELNLVWLPLLFPEEQYSVACLGDFWLNCLDALGDALERRGQDQLVEKLDQRVDALHNLPPAQRAKQGLAELQSLANKIQRRLLLLVDNVDLVLERAREEHWALREVLGHQPELLLIGASTQILEITHQYDAAFYDYFKVDELGGLTLEETGDVLLALDTISQKPPAEDAPLTPARQLVKNDRPRLKALHLLTGGTPRTIVLLHGVLGSGWGDGIRADMERLLDHCTPIYKARFESLSQQSQRVLDAVARHWHPLTARQAADITNLKINTVSSHLNRLVQYGFVEKTILPDKRKTGFQITERFFNIWYLMRANRRLRRRLTWLVEFLQMFFNQKDHDQQHIKVNFNHQINDQLIPALNLINQGKWSEARPQIERYWLLAKDDFSEKNWNDTLLLVQSTLTQGYGREMVALLDHTGMGERWLPLREAVNALAEGNPALLDGLAPEVATPARMLLEKLAPTK